MHGLIRHHHHADSGPERHDAAGHDAAEGIRAVRLSLAALMATAGLQLVVVLLTGSVALLADTIHNFSDALTSVPLWIAFVLGRRAPTRRFTFGYRRAEDMAGLFIVAMIALSVVVIAWESIQRLIDPRPIANLPLVAAAGLIGFAGNELVARYRIGAGRRIGSAALVADGQHARADALTSLAVVAGAIGVALGFPRADPIVGLLIVVPILFVLRDAGSQVFGRLMDAVDPALPEQAERVAGGVRGVEGVEQLRMRWLGHRLELALHVVVDCDVSVAAGHRIAEEVRHTLFHDIPRLDEVVVHVDPCLHRAADHHEVTAHHARR